MLNLYYVNTMYTQLYSLHHVYIVTKRNRKI